MKMKIEIEFESDDEEIGYRWADQCCFCNFVNSTKRATKLSQGGVPGLLYFCKKHSHYVDPDKICEEFLES